ncbi:MAG: PUA domain-containing protein [Nitrososphaerales archaeon]
MRVYNLSKSTRDEIILKVKGLEKLKPRDLKIAEPEGDSDSPIIFDKEEKLYLGRKKVPPGEEIMFPLLKDEKLLPTIPIITVDSGAVRFVCNGANVMRPGITKIEGDFNKFDLVLVTEQKYGKGIAVGRALLSSVDLKSASKGAVIENLHYVGDEFWESLKEIEGNTT